MDDGVEGVENLTGTDDLPRDITEEEAAANRAAQEPTHGTSGFQKLGENGAERPSDQEISDRRESELQAARDEHNKRTGGGAYPLSHER